ncbi:hypothetical protein T439DRAFT_312667 [Meredithblackwellia eburnea MCA 4105]
MFTFCIQKDTICIEARDFGKDPVDAIREAIHRRYANKVIPDVGLCISLLDILDTSEGAVLYGDGNFYYKVEFRLVIFRPYIGEALVGKVQSQSEAGITVSLGFFDDILITPSLLPDHSCFDPNRQNFFWVPLPDDDDDDNQEKTERKTPTSQELMATESDARLYIERRDWVRIRVEEEFWDDSSPVKPPSGVEPPPGANGEVPAAVPAKPPYRLVCSMTESGTGSVDWWDEAEPEEDEG